MEPLDQHDPRRIGPFEVLGRLGKGGMGLVYLGRSAAGRRVAIKTVRAELAEDKLFRARFEREIKAARTVGGFYTAAVVDADAQAPVPWLATAYVPAPSLEDLVVQCGPLPAGAVRWLAAGVAEALQSIHRAELVHRDLKPSNVLVVDDGPRVIDFGIAAGGQYTRVTMTNVAVGTPAYMSPEQARNSRGVTGPSDIFSLGSTLVYAATGHAPYRGSGPVDIVSQLLNREPDLSGLPDELLPLVKACLRHEINRRPTPEDLQAELAPQLFTSGESTGGAAQWLPPNALDFIEERSGRPIPRQEQPPEPPAPRPAADPRSEPSSARPLTPPPPPVQRQGESGEQGGDPSNIHTAAARAAEALGARQAAPAAPVQEPSAPSAGGADGAVRLAGSGIEIGPGPAAGAPSTPESVPVSLVWARGRQQAAVPVQGGEPGPAAAPAPAEAVQPVPAVAEPVYRRPAEWRPWRFRMSNGVWGSPMAWGGTIYVSSFEVHALELGSGQRRFKSNTPVWTMQIADGRVHAADGHSLYTFDAEGGSTGWQLTAGGWIYALTATGGALVAGTRGGGIQAWDAADGTVRWQLADSQTQFEMAQAGPEILGERVFYHGAGGGGLVLRCVDLRSGAPQWAVPLGGQVPHRPAEAPDGTVVAAAGPYLYGLDPASGAVLWRFDAPAEIRTPPVVLVDAGPATAVVADAAGGVWAVGASDGLMRWQGAVDSRPSGEAPVAADGSVLVVSGATVHALGAYDGRPRWRFDARGPVVGSPVHADGLVHVGSKDHRLYTVDAATGRLRWRLETDGEITGTPAVAGGAVCVCSADNCVYALDAAKGTDLKR